MRRKTIYCILLFTLILFLCGPSIASARTSAETVEKAREPHLAGISSPPPAASAAQETSAVRYDTPAKRLPLAPRSLGLRLVGTVVAADAEMSLAIIEQGGAGKQRIYYEGARVGKALIKRVLRNEVIIDAGRGDQRLTMLHGQAPGIEQGQQKAMGGQSVPVQQAPASQRGPGRHQTVQLDRQEVALALSDVNQVMQEVSLSPYTVYDRPAGFRITNIPPGSILAKMGLHNGLAITGVNGEAVTGPKQAAAFFERLKQGGQITIQTRKGRGVRRRTRFIHLEIQ